MRWVTAFFTQRAGENLDNAKDRVAISTAWGVIVPSLVVFGMVTGKFPEGGPLTGACIFVPAYMIAVLFVRESKASNDP